jgi:hypothetical protein
LYKTIICSLFKTCLFFCLHAPFMLFVFHINSLIFKRKRRKIEIQNKEIRKSSLSNKIMNFHFWTIILLEKIIQLEWDPPCSVKFSLETENFCFFNFKLFFSLCIWVINIFVSLAGLSFYVFMHHQHQFRIRL